MYEPRTFIISTTQHMTSCDMCHIYPHIKIFNHSQHIPWGHPLVPQQHWYHEALGLRQPGNMCSVGGFHQQKTNIPNFFQQFLLISIGFSSLCTTIVVVSVHFWWAFFQKSWPPGPFFGHQIWRYPTGNPGSYRKSWILMFVNLVRKLTQVAGS